MCLYLTLICWGFMSLVGGNRIYTPLVRMGWYRPILPHAPLHGPGRNNTDARYIMVGANAAAAFRGKAVHIYIFQLSSSNQDWFRLVLAGPFPSMTIFQ